MERLERFEKALQDILNEYDNLGKELEKLRKEGEIVMNNLKNILFEIGILIFCITVFCEQLFLGENNLTCFLKGLACGLEIIGAIVKLINKK